MFVFNVINNLSAISTIKIVPLQETLMPAVQQSVNGKKKGQTSYELLNVW